MELEGDEILIPQPALLMHSFHEYLSLLLHANLKIICSKVAHRSSNGAISCTLI